MVRSTSKLLTWAESTGPHHRCIPLPWHQTLAQGCVHEPRKPNRLCLGKFVREKHYLCAGTANHIGNVTPEASVAHLRAEPTGMKADLRARAEGRGGTKSKWHHWSHWIHYAQGQAKTFQYILFFPVGFVITQNYGKGQEHCEATASPVKRRKDVRPDHVPLNISSGGPLGGKNTQEWWPPFCWLKRRLFARWGKTKGEAGWGGEREEELSFKNIFKRCVRHLVVVSKLACTYMYIS